MAYSVLKPFKTLKSALVLKIMFSTSCGVSFKKKCSKLKNNNFQIIKVYSKTFFEINNFMVDFFVFF
jgi:hypothetical protein